MSDGRITILAVTTSAKDGSIDQVAAVPAVLADDLDHGPAGVVLPAGAPLAADELVVVRIEDVPDVPDGPDVQSVEVRSTGGELRRTLLDGYGTAEGGILDLEVSADRRTVLVALSTSACTSEVTAIAADGAGGPPASLGPGEQVALTPDGSHVAVLLYEKCGERPRIERRNLDGSGDPVQVALGGPASELVWIDDSTLVAEIRDESGSGSLVRWSMVDDALTPIPNSSASALHAPARTAQRSLSAAASGGEGRDTRVVLVDATAGRIRTSVAELGW